MESDEVMELARDLAVNSAELLAEELGLKWSGNATDGPCAIAKPAGWRIHFQTPLAALAYLAGYWQGQMDKRLTSPAADAG